MQWLAGVAAIALSAYPEAEQDVALSPTLSLGGCVDGGVYADAGPSAPLTRLNGRASGQLSPQAAFGLDAVGYYDVAHACFSAPADGAYVTLSVVDGGGADLTMAVTGEGGWVISDDDGGGDYLPYLSTWFPQGEYTVYVGTYSSGTAAEFVLEITPSAGGTY